MKKTEELNVDMCIDESICNTLRSLEFSKEVPFLYLTFASDSSIYINEPLLCKTKGELKEKVEGLHKKIGREWVADVLIFECKLLDGNILPKTDETGTRAAIFVPIGKTGIGLSHVIPFSFDGKGFWFESEKIVNYMPTELG